MRREILYLKMVRLGIPTIYIKCLSALYTDIQGSVRSFAGFFAAFRISQGTREGCILNPLLFVIILSDVINELQKVHLEAGHMMLGPLLLFAILFADDLVLFARSVKDLQSLIKTFANYCDKSHEQVAVDKTEAMIFHGFLMNILVKTMYLIINLYIFFIIKIKDLFTKLLNHL